MSKAGQNPLMPKYARTAVHLRDRIAKEEWSVGELLPAVPELQVEYDVSRMTLLRALKHLENEGLLSLEQGRGTFVRRNRAVSYVGMLFGDDIFNLGATPFTTLLAKAAQHYFEDREEELKFYFEPKSVGQSAQLDDHLSSDVDRNLVVGLITAGTNFNGPKGALPGWLGSKIPWVDISPFEGAPYRVVLDSLSGIPMGLEELARRGCRRVAVLGFGPDRHKVVEASVHLSGMESHPDWIIPFNHPSEAAGFEVTGALLDRGTRPDGLLILDDTLAKGVVQGLLARGLSAPRDLQLVAQANRGSNIFYPMKFPRLEFDPEYCLRMAAEMLMQRIEHPDLPPKTVTVWPQLLDSEIGLE
ncbi:MAG: GntR family transcriptional regulator [Kiritimatiellia bacterium]